MPVSIMAGRGDQIVDAKSQPMRLHKLIQQSSLEVIDGTGHMLHYAYPEKVAAKIEELCAVPR